MEVWSDGRETIVFEDSGLSFFQGEEVTEVCSVTGDTVYLGAKKAFRTSRPRLLAVDPRSRTALVGESQDVPYLFDLSRKVQPLRLGFAWAAAQHIQEQEYFAVLPEDEKLYFRFVRLSARGEILDEMDPQYPEINAVESGGITWARRSKVTGEEAPFPVRAPDLKGPFIISVNEYGVAAADLANGLVVVARQGERQFASAFLFAATGEETLLPCAAPWGLVISTTVQEKHSALSLFAFDGTKLGELTKFDRDLAWGGGMPFFASENRLCWPHSTREATVSEFEVPALTLVGEHKIPGGSVLYDRVSIVGPGHVVLGSRTVAIRLRREGESWVGQTVERKELPKKSRELRSDVSGPALLQLRSKSDQWKAAAGGAIALDMELANSGGTAEGLEVELSGDSVTSGIVQARVLRCGQLSAAFCPADNGTVRAVLPQVALGPACEKGAKRAKLEPWLTTFRVELATPVPGAALLMVRVRTKGNVTSATGRTLYVV